MPFTIVIDTREQRPYSFPCATVRLKLDAGDYAVLGREHQTVVERKSLADFVSTVIHGRERFLVELGALTRRTRACVVVEADLDAVLRGLRERDLRDVKPAALLGWATWIEAKYSVPVHFCGSRQAARAFTEAFLRMAVLTDALVEVPHNA